MRSLLMSITALSLTISAHPTHNPNYLTHRSLDLRAYQLSSRTAYTNAADTAANSPLPRIVLRSSLTQEAYLETAMQLVERIAPNATFRLANDHYIGDNDIAHVHFWQTVDGVDIDNAVLSVNIGRDGNVFSYGQSLYMEPIHEAKALLKRGLSDPVSALISTSSTLGLGITGNEISTERATGEDEAYVFKGTSGALGDPQAKLAFFAKPDGALALTWRVETNVETNWLLTYVDTASDEIHGIVDYVSAADFQVYDWTINNPDEGPRTIISDPWDVSASPLTWLSDGAENYTTTRGNNAIAQSNPSGDPHQYLDSYRPAMPSCNFTYSYSPSMNPADAYTNSSIVQLFYTANAYHDLLYTLGFTEAAGNFQWDNNGKGGLGEDYVILNAQDGGGYNNALFSTPPDGQPGMMRVTLWTNCQPYRDAVFDASVIVHEYTHGLSTRLTGGPANSGCLSSFEALGLGEGWSDFMAIAVRITSADTRETDYAWAAWATNNLRGGRAYPYSTSLRTNPLTYASVNDMNEMHAVGTVWASMLYEVLWNVVEKIGIDQQGGGKVGFDERGVLVDGRYLVMKLVMDGMALQPCNPTFVQSRDAILDADTALTGGANHCEIWKGFAKRGLGGAAKYVASDRKDSYDVPQGVC